MPDIRLIGGQAWLFDAVLESDFSGTQIRIVLAVLNRTDRYHPTLRASAKTLARYAGVIAEPDDHRPSGAFRLALRELVNAGVILEAERGVFAIERNPTRWRELRTAGDSHSGADPRGETLSIAEHLVVS